jgi:hypothetical protein
VRETVLLEILQRERKTVVNAYQSRRRREEMFYEPMTNRLARPVFAGAGRRRNFARLASAVRRVDAQALEAGLACLCAGVVDSNVPLKCRAHFGVRIGVRIVSLEFAQRNDIAFSFRYLGTSIEASACKRYGCPLSLRIWHNVIDRMMAYRS